MRARAGPLHRLPEGADARGYSGSLVNITTAYAFLETASAEGHRAVLATAGNSAMGRALAALARRRGVAALILVRSEHARTEMERHGVGDVLVVRDGEDADLQAFARQAEALGATAVFDGVGGGRLSRLLPHLPQGSTVYAYGFLAGQEPVSFPSALLMGRDLTPKRFSNFETPTVRDLQALDRALRALEAEVGDPLFLTRVGETFDLGDVEAAIAHEAGHGAKAVLLT